MKPKSQANVPLACLAAMLAWIVPGAGHVAIGRPVRGIILCLTIAATFWAGVAMGGVMTVDPENEHWWFVADLITGVHGLAAWQLQQHTCDRIASEPEVRQRQALLSYDPAQAAAVMDQKLQERRPGPDQPHRHRRTGLLGHRGAAEPHVHLRRHDPALDGDPLRAAPARQGQTAGSTVMTLGLIFYHPMTLPVDSLLWLMLPLTVCVAVVYKTVRVNNLRRLPLSILGLVVLVTVGVAALAVGLWAVQAYCL